MENLTRIQEINQAIMFGEFTSTELESMVSAIQFARAQIGRQKARTFKIGDPVKFRDLKRGVSYQGNVEKIKLKFALVRTATTRVNVPLSMLESV